PTFNVWAWSEGFDGAGSPATPLLSYPGIPKTPGAGLPPAGSLRDESARRVEEWRGCAKVPFPFPAHRTGRADFRHPALRQTSRESSRRLARPGAAVDAEDSEDGIRGEPAGPADPAGQVAAAQKRPHPLLDVAIHDGVG